MNWKADESMNGDLNKVSIDERLASPSQESIRQLVKALPEDMPSMAWRSELNSKLALHSAQSRSRRRIWWVVSPSFGLALTAVLCLTVFAPRHTVGVPPAPIPAPKAVASLEDQLVASHSDSDTSQDVVGSGLSAGEVQQSSDDPDAQDAPTS